MTPPAGPSVMSDEVEVLRAVPQDWRAVRALRLRALQEAPQAFATSYAERAAWSDEDWQAWLERATAGASHWLYLARAGGDLVGMAGTFLDQDQKDGVEAVVVAVYVEPRARRHGVARRLLEALIADLRAQGVRSWRLEVNADQTAAVALYRNLGFVPYGEQVTRMGDGVEHRELLMRRTEGSAC